FARQAERTPDAVAVSAGGVRLTYRELARRGSAVAGRLAAEHVGPDTVVILLAERGADFLSAMIGVQRSGRAVLPPDPTNPPGTGRFPPPGLLKSFSTAAHGWCSPGKPAERCWKSRCLGCRLGSVRKFCACENWWRVWSDAPPARSGRRLRAWPV